MFSIWEKETTLAAQDVVIAGGGFAGLWTAFHLRRKFPKAFITLIEKDFMPMGASSRNAGFACFGSLGELLADVSELGPDATLDLVELRYRGLQQIGKYFKPGTIDYKACGGYELFAAGPDNLEDNMARVNGWLRGLTGRKRTFRNASGKIGSFGFGDTAALVFNEAEGALHSGMLNAALRRKLQKSGVQFLTGVTVTGYQEQADCLAIDTSAGFTIRARYLAVCTNTGAGALLPGIEVRPARGQVLLTSPVARLPWKGTFHADEGYYYFRNLGDRVLLGGARNKAFEAEESDERITTPLIQNELERFLDETVLPGRSGSYTIDHRWSGIMGMGPDKQPIIRAFGTRIVAAVALGGIGVAVAPEAGRKLARLIEL